MTVELWAEIFLKLKFKYLFSKMSSTLDFSGEITVYHSIQLHIYTKRSTASSKDPGILRGSGSTSQNYIFFGILCLLVILLWLLHYCPFCGCLLLSLPCWFYGQCSRASCSFCCTAAAASATALPSDVVFSRDNFMLLADLRWEIRSCFRYSFQEKKGIVFTKT